jgi:hypothetical protein
MQNFVWKTRNGGKFGTGTILKRLSETAGVQAGCCDEPSGSTNSKTEVTASIADLLYRWAIVLVSLATQVYCFTRKQHVVRQRTLSRLHAFRPLLLANHAFPQL